MTRVNLVPVQELMDQHLFAEFRELKMIPKSLQRSIKARDIDYNPDSLFDSGSVMAYTPFNNDYLPTTAALAVIRHRIAERIAMKPSWYRRTV